MPRNNKYGYKQQQEQINLVAHDRKLAFENLYYLMEGLEEYMEKSGNFPNFKRSFRNITVPKEKNYSLNSCENLFRTRLLLFVGILDDNTPDDTRKEVQKEFYKWIENAGIDANNCPDEKLKHFLVEVNNVIEGKGEKIVEQTKKYLGSKKKTNLTGPEDMGDVINVFSSIQSPLEKKREEAKSYENKNYFEVEVESKFGKGSGRQGEKVFGKISKEVASGNRDFYFFPQLEQQSSSTGSNVPLDNNSTNLNEVVQVIKTNPQNWSLDEIITEFSNLGGEKKEIVLYHKDARLNDYDQRTGKLNFNNNPIYRWENFTTQQRFEIKQAKGLSGDYLTSEEIKWVVREVKNDPGVWEIRKIDAQIWLVHNSAQTKKDEIGTLIHNQQKFSEVEWAEISGILARINDIKQNATLEKGLCVLNRETREVSESEDWFIHSQLKREFDEKTGYLIYVPNAMIRAKDLSEGEQKAVGYKLEQTQQVQGSQSSSSRSRGVIGSPFMWGSFTIISLIGLAFTR